MSVLCALAMDDKVGAKKAIQSYSIDDANFDSSTEMTLCNNLIECIEERGGNREEFTAFVTAFN